MGLCLLLISIPTYRFLRTSVAPVSDFTGWHIGPALPVRDGGKSGPCLAKLGTGIDEVAALCGMMHDCTSHASAVAQGSVVRAMSTSYKQSLYSTLRRSQTP
jgi:hypothetical protein